MTTPIRSVAMMSGGGRTVLNLADRIDAGTLDARIVSVIASRPGIDGIQRAEARGLPVSVARLAPGESTNTIDDRVSELITAASPDLVCLCGYLRLLRLDAPFADRVINIHPALLPRFGGKGMHGTHVHRAVLAAGVPVSGCTVHFVDGEYDHGPTILQRACFVDAGDTPESLADRVFAQECLALPDAIDLFAEGRISRTGEQVRILPGAMTPGGLQ